MQAGSWIGPYQVERELGRGGMAVVFLVRDREGGSFALKLLQREGFLEPESLARFELEARAMAALDHPHVLRVRDCGNAPPGPYLVLDYVPGESLAARLKRGGPLGESAAISLLRVLCDAVEHAHAAGVLHRDLKPDNVLLRADGRALLSDFGLARRIGAQQQLTRTGEIVGTPATMAPEQIEGGEQGPATDVYGLGGLLYAALTGRAPFSAPSTLALLDQVMSADPSPPSLHAPGSVSPQLDAIVLRCLAKEPQERFPSAAALGEALEHVGGRRATASFAPAGAGLLASALLIGIGGWLGARGGPAAGPSSPPSSPSARVERASDLKRALAELAVAIERNATGDADQWAPLLERARAATAPGSLQARELDLLWGSLLARDRRRAEARRVLQETWTWLVEPERDPATEPLLWHDLVYRCAKELGDAGESAERAARAALAARAVERWADRAPTSPRAHRAVAFLRFVKRGEERRSAGAALLQAIAHAEGEERIEYERTQLWLEVQEGQERGTPAQRERLERLWGETRSSWQRRKLCELALGPLRLGRPWAERREQLWREHGPELAAYVGRRTQHLVEAGRLPLAEALARELLPRLEQGERRFELARAEAWAWLGWGRLHAEEHEAALEAFARSCALRVTVVAQVGLGCALWPRDPAKGLAALREARPLLEGRSEIWGRIVAGAERLAAGGSVREALRSVAPRSGDPRVLRAWLRTRWLELVLRAAGLTPAGGWKLDLERADWRQLDQVLAQRAGLALDSGQLRGELAARLCWLLVVRSEDPTPWEERGALAAQAWATQDPARARAFAGAHPFSDQAPDPPRAGIAKRALQPLLGAAGNLKGELSRLCRSFRRQRLGQALALSRALSPRLEKAPGAQRLCKGLGRDAEHLLGLRRQLATLQARISASSLTRLRHLNVLQAAGAELALQQCLGLLGDERAKPSDLAVVRYLQVQALNDLGRTQEALQVLRAVIPTLKGYDFALSVLEVQLLTRLEQREEALREAKALALRYPSRIPVQLLLANLLTALGRYEEAAQVLARCRSLDAGQRPQASKRIERAEARLRAQSGRD